MDNDPNSPPPTEQVTVMSFRHLAVSLTVML
jgi:hypothetical protein